MCDGAPVALIEQSLCIVDVRPTVTRIEGKQQQSSIRLISTSLCVIFCPCKAKHSDHRTARVYEAVQKFPPCLCK